MQEYVRNPEDQVKSDQPESSRKRKGKKKGDSDENMSDVNHILGGLAAGDSGKSSKDLAHQLRHKPNSLEVNLTNQSQRLMVRVILIIFSEDDASGAHYPYCDTLVGTLLVTNKCIHQILINNGSSTDILFCQHLLEWDWKDHS